LADANETLVRQQLGLLVNGVAELIAAFSDLAVFHQDAIHRTDRAKIDALVQQGGIDLGGGLVDKPGRSQNIEDSAAFVWSKGPQLRAPGWW
jgi:hypothetical protein